MNTDIYFFFSILVCKYGNEDDTGVQNVYCTHRPIFHLGWNDGKKKLLGDDEFKNLYLGGKYELSCP